MKHGTSCFDFFFRNGCYMQLIVAIWHELQENCDSEDLQCVWWDNICFMDIRDNKWDSTTIHAFSIFKDFQICAFLSPFLKNKLLSTKVI